MSVSGIMGQTQITAKPVVDNLARREFSNCNERAKTVAASALKVLNAHSGEAAVCWGACTPLCIYLAKDKVPECIAACAAACSKLDGWKY